MRDGFLRTLVVLGAALYISTEAFGALHQIRRNPLLVWWAISFGTLLIMESIRVARALPASFQTRRFTTDPVVILCAVGVIAILILTGVTAALSPPNSADAMAYHMPRVVYWAEQSGVGYFPTPYFNQIMLQPFAEYLMLHTYVLSGGDHFINFVQWFASVACIVGVSAIAGMFGAGSRGQAVAALFCATLPAGILASSGAKNDYFMAMWLVAAVYFALRFSKAGGRTSDALYLGAALGFALLTKATAYLFAPWLLAAILFLKRPRRPLLLAAALALAINTPLYVRNYRLSGSVMGFDSAQGDGVFRWRNETFGWKPTASNILRNVSDQTGARSSGWDRGVYKAVAAAHNWLGLDLNDPSSTFRGSVYGPPLNANHEANAPNRWHLLILTGAVCAFWLRRRGMAEIAYGAALLCAFIAFCGYLKWQAFFGRLLLPLFVLGAPLVRSFGNVVVSLLVCLFLLDNARHPVFDNWVRPLRGPASVFLKSRDDQYFSDMTQWNNQASYVRTVDLLARTNCDTVGVDINNLQLEYPLQALLRERRPGTRFFHSGVKNVSTRYSQPVTGPPCAVVCLDCAGDEARLASYRSFGRPAVIDRFVVFLPAGTFEANGLSNR